MDAHEMAQSTLKNLHFTEEDDLWKAHQKVIKESAAQNEQIRTFLMTNHIDEEAISVCRTKMMVLYLLKKKERVVKRWAHSGILNEPDVELLLEDSEHEMMKALDLQPSEEMSRMTLDLTSTKKRSARPLKEHGSYRLGQYGNVGTNKKASMNSTEPSMNSTEPRYSL